MFYDVLVSFVERWITYMSFIVKFCHFYNALRLEYGDMPPFIYHYTSSGAAQSIISKGQMRFTDRYYLNDASEGRYVLDLCSENIEDLLPDSSFRRYVEKGIAIRKEQIQKDKFYVYQCSFSTNPDNLCLWNYYSKSQGIKGYNFKFSTSDLAENIKPTAKEEGKELPVYFGKVVYDKTEQIDIIKRILKKFVEFIKGDLHHEEFVAAYAVNKIIEQGVFFKKDVFSVEEEYRIAISPYVNTDGQFATIKEKRYFMERNGIFIPYVDINFPPDSLQSITISPTLDYQMAKQSLEMLLADKYQNMSSEAIIQSAIPIRY